MKSGREFQEYISAHCLHCSNQLFDLLLLDKSNMVNNVPENDDCLCLIHCNVGSAAVALLLVKYVKTASKIDYGVLLSGMVSLWLGLKIGR